MKIINHYIFPIIVVLLLLSFIIYASVKPEGFTNGCACPSGTQLRNGGCLYCPDNYTLNNDYYNSRCISHADPYKTIAPSSKKIEC